jgi:PhnB protein
VPSTESGCLVVSPFEWSIRNRLGGRFFAFEHAPSAARADLATSSDQQRVLLFEYAQESNGFEGCAGGPMNIPEGFACVTPYIFAKDAGEYMDHLIAALGGVDSGRTTGDDGRLANGQVRFHDATVMVSEAGRGFAPSQAAFYVYVDNADASMQRALDNGMIKVMDVGDMPYGDRQGGVRDIAGNIWWISQRLTDAPYHDAASKSSDGE